MQYLYASGQEHTFMDTGKVDQITLHEDKIKWELNFLKENMLFKVASYQGEVLGVNLPNTVELEVKETEPGVRGNTAQGATKNAVLETGFRVQVPLFINEGDKLIINTAKGEYVSRA